MNNSGIYDFLKVYDIPNSTITKLKNGTNNRSKDVREVHLKNKLYFKETEGNVFDAFSHLEEEIKRITGTPRYLFVTDFDTILAKDTKTGEPLDISFEELPLHFGFFLAWNGIEKVDFEKENPLDIKAAERFARLFDVLNKEIDRNSENEIHSLNLFLMRLLFCLFAEDTGIFEKGIFTNGIKKYTDEDGKNMNGYISELFKVLDMPLRDGVDTIYQQYPYVNGQLFSESHKPIRFNYKARKLMIECGELLEWSKINPDIFGSMIQAVATEERRSHLGMHYTSIPNIMKVINPLFLDDIKQKFEEIRVSWEEMMQNKTSKKIKFDTLRKNHEKQLESLMIRISKMKFFDPACGSGNFLIITYKELRNLEIQIYKLLNEIHGSEMFVYDPIVTLSQFYGIEIDEFAHDIAKLSLWIAEHQMNLSLKGAIVNAVRPTLPLKSAGEIRCGNALRIDWKKICPSSGNEEIFVFGNPPYVGTRNQLNNHKKDMQFLFEGITAYKRLDYICGWFYLASKYIKNINAKYAFVSTNSICQGEQVEHLWLPIFSEGSEITFAYNSFPWNNSAKNRANVIVIIVGVANIGTVKSKYIFNGGHSKKVDNISPYLIPGPNVIVHSITKPLHKFPKLSKGNAAYDDGNLTFSRDEYIDTIANYPETKPFFRKFINAEDFINGDYKYCLWIPEICKEAALSIPFIFDRVERVRNYRLSSERAITKRQAIKSFAFGEIRYEERDAIIIPVVSSESREYIPMGYINPEVIPSYATFTIYGGSLFLLGILMSKMHMVWVRAVGGKLKSDFRYSAGLCYNTFPIPAYSSRETKDIEEKVLEILDIREEYGENLAYLYNRKTIPSDLKKAHSELDLLVEKKYKNGIFISDEQRLELLLEQYQAIVGR